MAKFLAYSGQRECAHRPARRPRCCAAAGLRARAWHAVLFQAVAHWIHDVQKLCRALVCGTYRTTHAHACRRPSSGLAGGEIPRDRASQATQCSGGRAAAQRRQASPSHGAGCACCMASPRREPLFIRRRLVPVRVVGALRLWVVVGPVHGDGDRHEARLRLLLRAQQGVQSVVDCVTYPIQRVCNLPRQILPPTLELIQEAAVLVAGPHHDVPSDHRSARGGRAHHARGRDARGRDVCGCRVHCQGNCEERAPHGLRDVRLGCRFVKRWGAQVGCRLLA
mmetsp:Transcript_22265/g.65628  ORF Transcript_22265/g.65628 Transcript_22265/m.65628 type:complete len:280 (-) Transcript_22265:34-873(-)